MIFSNVISWVYGQKITLNTILQDPVSSFYTPCNLSDFGVSFTLFAHFLSNIRFHGFHLGFQIFLSMTSSLLPLLLFSAFFLSFFPLHLLPLLFLTAAAAAAKSLQSCLTLCDPIDCSPPGSTVPGILQARTLEWVAISFSNAWKWKVKVKSFSRVWLFSTSRTAAYQAPPSMGFSRQECWSGLALPSPIPYYTLENVFFFLWLSVFFFFGLCLSFSGFQTSYLILTYEKSVSYYWFLEKSQMFHISANFFF